MNCWTAGDQERELGVNDYVREEGGLSCRFAAWGGLPQASDTPKYQAYQHRLAGNAGFGEDAA